MITVFRFPLCGRLFFRGRAIGSNRGLLFSRITIHYMTLKTEILNRGRVFFADWMSAAKTAKIRRPREKTRYTVKQIDTHPDC